MARCAWCGADNAPDGSFCAKCGKPLPWGEVSGVCEKCGASNASGMTTCGSCGAPLPESKPAPPVPREPAAGSRCGVCGKEVPPGASMCYECAKGDVEDYHVEADYVPHSEPLNAASALLIIAGILTFIQGFVFMAGVSISDYGSGFLTCCGFLEILFGLGTIAGGYSVVKRDNFSFAVVGCVLAIVSLGAIIGTLLGLIALMIVLANKEEFY